MEFDPVSYMMGAKAGGGGVPSAGLAYVMNNNSTDASRLICRLSGRMFYKSFKDPCFAAWYTIGENSGPFLVSETENGAAFGQNYDATVLMPIATYLYKGVTYHLSALGFFLPANTSTEGFAEFLGTYDTSVSGWQQKAADDLLSLVFET